MRALSRGEILAGVLTIVVVASAVTGTILVGTPSQQRERQLDERRLRDMEMLAQLVDRYWARHAELPGSLDILGSEPGSKPLATDPGSGELYRYRPLETETYEVCARFTTPSEASYTGPWPHNAGLECFRRQVRKNSAN
jgi:hypothetical protein